MTLASTSNSSEIRIRVAITVPLLLLSISYDLSDAKLAEALDDRASLRRFCGFSGSEATPERTAFVRYRRTLVAHGLGVALFDAVTGKLKARAVTVKVGTLVDATIITFASQDDSEGRWVNHKGRNAVHGFKAHVGAIAHNLKRTLSIVTATA